MTFNTTSLTTAILIAPFLLLTFFLSPEKALAGPYDDAWCRALPQPWDYSTNSDLGYCACYSGRTHGTNGCENNASCGSAIASCVSSFFQTSTGGSSSDPGYQWLCGNSANSTSIWCSPAACYPWGNYLAHGMSVNYYNAAIVNYPASCTGGTFTCSNGTLLGYTSGMAAAQSCRVAYPATAYINANGLSELHLYPGDSWPTINWSSLNMDPVTSMNGGSNFGGTGGPANDYCNVSGWGYIPSFGSSLNGSKSTGGIITPNMVGCWRNQFVYGYNIAGVQSNIAYATVYIDAAPIYGCTNSSATNYNPLATVDNGTCTYPLPTCSSSAAQTPSTTATSGTFYAYAYGVSAGVTSVSFPTWGDPGGQDDIVWYPGTNLGSGTWRASINLANHKSGNPEYGGFNVHVYMNDNYNTNIWCGTANFTRTLPAPTASLSVSPTSVAYNGRPTLTWSSTNATSCTAPSGNWSNSGTLSGSGLTDPLTTNTTFTFQCTGPGGTSALQSASVTVAGAPVNGVCGSANGVTYAYGASSYTPNVQCSSGTSSNTAFPAAGSSVSWTCVGANGGTTSGTCSASRNSAAACALPWGGTTASGTSVTAYQASSVISPATCASQSRTCTDGSLSGSYAYQSCSVSQPVPTATISVSPSTVNVGQSSTLTWSSTNATSCTAAGGFSTGGATSGSVSTGALSLTSVYQMSCTGPGGTTASPATATVTVLEPQVAISATPVRVLAGNRSTITWTTANVVSCEVAGPGLSSTNLNGSRDVVVNSQVTFTITCQTLGSPVPKSATVNVAPTFKGF